MHILVFTRNFITGSISTSYDKFVILLQFSHIDSKENDLYF